MGKGTKCRDCIVTHLQIMLCVILSQRDSENENVLESDFKKSVETCFFLGVGHQQMLILSVKKLKSESFDLIS